MKRTAKKADSNTRSYRQLDAIELTLTQVVSSVQRQEAANESSHSVSLPNAPIEIKRTSKTLEVARTIDGVNDRKRTMQLAPLFVGSHSQTEVSIDTQGVVPQYAQAEAARQVRALDPVLYYTRFSSQEPVTHDLADRQSISLLLALPVEHSISIQNHIKNLHAFSSAIALSSKVTILSWNNKPQVKVPSDEALHAQIVEQLQINEKININSAMLRNDDSVGLFRQLSQHDLALLPSQGLLMDALNAGNASALWINPDAGPKQLMDLQNREHCPVLLRQKLRNLAGKQRREFIQKQLDEQLGTMITNRSDSVFKAVDSLFRNHENDTASANEEAANETPYVSADSVISVNTEAAYKRGSDWSQFFDRVRRKSRKLRHSPVRFLIDSQWRIVKCATRLVARKHL